MTSTTPGATPGEPSMGLSGAEGAAPWRFLTVSIFCKEMGVMSFCFTKTGGPGGLCSLCDTNGSRGGGRGAGPCFPRTVAGDPGRRQEGRSAWPQKYRRLTSWWGHRKPLRQHGAHRPGALLGTRRPEADPHFLYVSGRVFSRKKYTGCGPNSHKNAPKLQEKCSKKSENGGALEICTPPGW